MTKGLCFGLTSQAKGQESKIITATPFTSVARFPEGGATLQWRRADLLRRLYTSRDLSMHYLHNLAHRLEGTFASLGGRSGIKLGGNLGSS